MPSKSTGPLEQTDGTQSKVIGISINTIGQKHKDTLEFETGTYKTEGNPGTQDPAYGHATVSGVILS